MFTLLILVFLLQQLWSEIDLHSATATIWCHSHYLEKLGILDLFTSCEWWILNGFRGNWGLFLLIHPNRWLLLYLESGEAKALDQIAPCNLFLLRNSTTLHGLEKSWGTWNESERCLENFWWSTIDELDWIWIRATIKIYFVVVRVVKYINNNMLSSNVFLNIY